MKWNYVLIEKNGIERIRGLWEKLNQLHGKDSTYFKDHYKSFSFEKRVEKFALIEEENLWIEVVEKGGVPVGYCLSSFINGTGEIDSLYIEEEHRNSGAGRKLVENSISWFESKKCEKIMVSVAEGHESVFGFYEKSGFFPRMTYLQRK